MATEVEYVNYKDFVADLESIENPGVDDVNVVSNKTDGPRAVPANTSALSNTATDSDMTAAASFELQTAIGKKKVPANLLAKQSGLETTNGNVTALTTYAQNVANSIAPPFDPTKPNDEGGYAYYAGTPVMYNGSCYVFASNKKSGVWDYSVVEKKPLSESIQTEGVGQAVNEWLNEHPEATTTVEDDSLTDAKLKGSIKFNVASGTGYSGRKIVDKDDDIFDVMSYTDTIYEIRWDFDLNGGKLEVPDNCALKFNGGKLSNGTIDFNNCKILAGEEQIFEDILPDADCKLSQGVNIRWFGAVGDGVADDTDAVKSAIAFGKKIYNINGNSHIRDYTGAGVVIFAQKNNYFRITEQVKVDYTCSVIGDFVFIYDGEKTANEGAINFTGVITYSNFSFAIMTEGPYDFSDGINFCGVSFGLPTEYLLMENCKVSLNVKGFYSGIQIYGDLDNGPSYAYNNEFSRCRLAMCLNGFNIVQYNSAWHNTNKFIDIWHTTGTSGFTVPAGFTKSVAFNFVGDGTYWPNSLIFERVNIEGYPLNNSNYCEMLISVTSSDGLTRPIRNWTLRDIRVENVNADGVVIETNTACELWSISFEGSMYGIESKSIKVGSEKHYIYSKLNRIQATKRESIYEDKIVYSDMVKEVSNGGYGYRSSNKVFFQVLAGIADLTASFSPILENRLNRFYGCPTRAYTIAAGKKITIIFDRVNALYSKTFVYTSAGALVEGANLDNYVKAYDSSVRVDTNGFIFQEEAGKSAIRIINISEDDIVIVPMCDGGSCTVLSDDPITYYTSDTSVVPFVGDIASQPSTSSVYRGFIYREVNTNNLYERYTGQTGTPYWKNVTDVRYTWGASDKRPTTLNNNTDIGYSYYDTTLQMPILWNGTKWKKYDGTDADPS